MTKTIAETMTEMEEIILNLRKNKEQLKSLLKATIGYCAFTSMESAGRNKEDMNLALLKIKAWCENVMNEQLQRILHYAGKYEVEHMDYENLKEENKQLKKLLKECKTPLEVYNEMFGYKEELLAKINQALGEGK